MKRKIILDCDPGHDDAIAILLAGKSKKIDLIGVSTSSGNQTIDKTSLNALNVCRYLNLDVPIAIGVEKPLIRKVEVCEAIHGESGLDGFSFPLYERNFSKEKGPLFIASKCLENDKVTIVITGPCTNVALALLLYPEIKEHIEEIVLMGGSIANGNVSPAAEFNILCDPEAAHIIFTSSLKIKMIGLDVTRKVIVLPLIMERMEKINNRNSQLFYSLMKVFNENQRKVFGLEGGPLHDPATIVSLIDDSVIKFKKVNVEVDLSHGISYGRTNCDVFDYLKKNKNAYVATDIDVNQYWDIIEETLKVD